MGTLAEKVAALRVKMSDAHADEITLATRLKAEILARDAELMTEIMGIIQDHESRRRDVVNALEILSRRIGRLPRAPATAAPSLGEGAAQSVTHQPGPPPVPGGLNGVH